MKLIIDTSSIISALIKNGASRKILFSKQFTFIAPDHTLKEIIKYKDLICKKAKNKFYQNAKKLITDKDDVPLHFKKFNNKFIFVRVKAFFYRID